MLCLPQRGHVTDISAKIRLNYELSPKIRWGTGINPRLQWLGTAEHFPPQNLTEEPRYVFCVVYFGTALKSSLCSAA